MSFFTTRVELHKASTAEDYAKLHTEMEKEGFWRTIAHTGDPSYHLPTAEYNYSSDRSTTVQVLEIAKLAAARTKKTFSVLVTKVADDRREWYNLEPVK